MESLADPYRCLLEIKGEMQVGLSLRAALRSFVKRDSTEFSASLGRWLILFEQGKAGHAEAILKKNSYRMSLLSIFSAGLNGESVFERLSELEEEIHQASLDEIEEKLRVLPLKMLVPLLLFQFPAFLLLLFGPILQQLQSSLS